MNIITSGLKISIQKALSTWVIDLYYLRIGFVRHISVWFWIGNCIGMIVIGIGYGISNDIELGIAIGNGIGLLLASLVL